MFEAGDLSIFTRMLTYILHDNEKEVNKRLERGLRKQKYLECLVYEVNMRVKWNKPGDPPHHNNEQGAEVENFLYSRQAFSLPSIGDPLSPAFLIHFMLLRSIPSLTQPHITRQTSSQHQQHRTRHAPSRTSLSSPLANSAPQACHNFKFRLRLGSFG